MNRTVPLLLVNESGLYRVIMRSNKPEAERFQDWVFGEVLPQIRKTGEYAIKTKTKAPRTPKPLTPAQIRLEQARTQLEEARMAVAQAKADIVQERVEVRRTRLSTMLVEAKPALALPAPQQLPVIQWLDDHHIKLLPWQEGHFGKLCAKLSREQGRAIGHVSDRRWKDEQGNWKQMGTYDVKIIEEVWGDFHT